MNLIRLKEIIDKDIPGGTILLCDKTTGLDSLDAFLQRSFALKELQLSNIAIDLKGEQLVLKGKTTLFKMKDLYVEFTFIEENKSISFDAKFRLSISSKLDPPGLKMSGIVFESSGANATNIKGFIGGYTTVFGKTDVSLGLRLPTLKDNWYISSSAKDIPKCTPTELLKWVNAGDSLGDFLPAGFGEIKNLSVSHFGLVLKPSTKDITLFSLDITAEAINLIPGAFSIQNFSFSIQISHPFKAEKRSVSGELKGVFRISDTSIPVFLSREGDTGDWDFWVDNEYAFQLPDFGRVITAFAGEGFECPSFIAGITKISLKKLSATFNLKERTVSSFALQADSNWDIIPGKLAITDAGLKLSVAHVADAKKRKTTASVWGTVAIGKLNVSLSGDYDKELVLGGAIPALNIKELFTEVYGGAITLPAFIPDVDLKNIKVNLTPATGAFTIGATAAATWQIGTEQLKVEVTAGAGFKKTEKDKTGDLQFTVTLKVSGKDKEGKLSVVEGLALQNFTVTFSKSGAGEWLAKGNTTAWLFDRKVTASISFKTEAKKQALEFSLSAGTPDEELVKIDELATIYGSSIAVKLIRQENAPTNWEFSAASRLRLLDIGDIGGTLEIKNEAKKPGIVLKIKGSDFELSPFEELLSVRLKSGEFRFGKESGNWSFEASSSLVVKGLPQFLYDQKIIPDELTTSLKIEGKSIAITLKEVTGLMEFEIPDIPVSTDGSVVNLADLRKLGKPAIQLVDLEFLLGKKSHLSLGVGFRFPEKINNIFGEKNGQPSVEIFETEQLFKLKFGIRYKNGWGVFCMPASSPFKGIGLSDGILDLDFGEYGQIDVKVPELSSDGTSFSASAGFKISKERPLFFPLKPFKKLLEQTVLHHLTKILPDKVPVKGIEFFKGGKLQVEPLMDFLRATQLDGSVLAAIEKVLELIAGQARKLPEALTEYLNSNFLESFDGRISVSAAGGINIKIDVKNSPIRILYPMKGVVPCLQGITFRGFSFGNVLGASLFSMTVDADIDTFDLPSLLAGLLLPELGVVIPEKNFHDRLLIHNLWMLIAVVNVGPVPVPIPVPLFYDRLGIDSQGIEGTHFKANAIFRTPEADPMGILKMLLSMKAFFTKKEAKLVNNPKAPQLEFKLEDCYLKLPPFLGGALLGAEGEVLKLNAMDQIVEWLNLIKFFNPVEAMLAIPIIHRFGEKEVKFGPLSMQAHWLFTSIDEFNDRHSYRQISIPDNEKNSYLELIGTQPGRGFVTFLKGETKIDGLGALKASFGLVVKNGTGMMTHYKLEGDVKQLVYFHSQGTAALKHEDNKSEFLISGKTNIKVGQLQVFDGYLYLKAQKGAFDLNGRFDLFPEESPIKVGGWITGYLNDKSLYIEGGITAALGIIVLTEVRAEVRFRPEDTEKGVWLTANFFGQKNSISVTGTNAIELKATLPSLLNTELKGHVAVKGDKVETLYATADLFKLYRITVSMVSSTPAVTTGTMEIISLAGFPLKISGKAVSHSDYFQFRDVSFHLFPAGNPVFNITGTNISGTFSTNDFFVTGTVTATGIFGQLLGASTIHIAKKGFVLSTTLLGIAQHIAIKDNDTQFDLNFAVAFGVLSFRTDIFINKDGNCGIIYFKGEVPGLFSFYSDRFSIAQTGGGSFYIDLFSIQRFLSGKILIQPGFFKMELVVKFDLLGIFKFDGWLKGDITDKGFSLKGECFIGFSILIHTVRITGSAFLSNDQFSISLGSVAVSIRSWKATTTFNRFHINNPVWHSNALPCFMAGIVWPPLLGKNLIAKRLDGHEEMISWFGWGSWGEDTDTRWPDDLRPGEKSDFAAAGDDFEGIEPMPFEEVAKELIYGEILKQFSDEPASGRAKSMQLTLAKHPVFYQSYPSKEKSGGMVAEVMFHHLTDDDKFLQELKAGARESAGEKKSGLLSSDNMNVNFILNKADGQLKLELQAANGADFKPIAVAFNFEEPATAFHEIGLLI